jgi:xeroderma pigmentosum group C-complementing protein
MPEAGGFLLETADTVVQAFTLPKSLHVVDPSFSKDVTLGDTDDSIILDADIAGPTRVDDTEDADADMEEIVAVADPNPNSRVGAPPTMQQLAEANAQELTTASLEPPIPESHNNENLRATRVSRRANGDVNDSVPSRGRSTRGRKRTRDPSDSEAAEEEDERPKRGKAKAETTPVPAMSTRTLRARVPKSDEKKRREREMEQAYRRAIAE